VELLPGDVLGGLRVTVTTSFSQAVDFVVFPSRRAEEDRLTSAHDWPTAQDFESRVLFRFEVSILDSLRAGTTFSQPTVRLLFGEVDTDVTFSVHRVTSAWTEEAATWERLDFGQPWGTPGGDFDPAPVATFTVTPLPPDTATADTAAARPDSVRVPIPLDLFEGWRSGAIPNHGLILLQETPAQVVDFVSRGDNGNNVNGPTLEVEADVPDAGFASLDILAAEDIFLPIDRSPFPAGGLVLRGAEPPHRMLLEPTLEDIPAGSSIATVQLVLTLQAVDIPRDSMHVFAVLPVTEFRGESTVFASLLGAVAGTVLQATAQPGDTVVLEAPPLTRVVRAWLRNPDTNLGVGLRLGDVGPTSEALFLGGVQFHGPDAPLEQRPRLRIVLVPSVLGGADATPP
jgi:hypothetical protein